MDCNYLEQIPKPHECKRCGTPVKTRLIRKVTSNDRYRTEWVLYKCPNCGREENQKVRVRPNRMGIKSQKSLSQ